MAEPIILAPAGTSEAVTAAVRCGADAVYLGATHFNARRNAENFDDMALPETVRFCHERGSLVFVTVNTLVTDSEMPLLEEEADLVARSGADAVIIQDPAVMRLFREKYPALPRHGSTQTVVHDLRGALYLEELGYETIVLARELTLGEMEKICARLTTAKAEAFVHGAHCMSVSGACYLSAMLGGRSGNRGLCAQPCRLDWQCGKADHALSLKDMSLYHHVRDMRSAGIGVLKIEGRMKRPEYVAAVVTACKNALRGEPWDEEQLKSVFSRSGFTDGYLMGRRDGSMYGYRTREDVVSAEGVLKDLAALYRNETPRVPVEMKLSVTGEGSVLTVSDGTHAVTVNGGVPEIARNRPLDREAAEKNLVKTGGTPYYVNSFSAQIAPGLILPASGLNAMRREAVEKLGTLRRESPAWQAREGYALPRILKRSAPAEPGLWARFADPAQIPAGETFEKLLLPAGCIRKEHIDRWGDTLAAELPALVWPEDEDAFREKLLSLRDMGLREILADNIYAIPLARELGLTLHGGAGLNILNTEALRHYEEAGFATLTASAELQMSKIKALGGTVPLGILAYGRLPLMRFRNCPLRAHVGCAGCGGHGELTDRKGIRFPVECSGKKYSTLLNSVPLHIAERDLRGVDHLLLYFTRESREEAARIMEDYRLHRRSADQRTGGLYYRELL